MKSMLMYCAVEVVTAVEAMHSAVEAVQYALTIMFRLQLFTVLCRLQL